MTAEERFYTALSGGKPDRVPVLPKIWVDLAATLTDTPLAEAIADPQLGMRLIVDAARQVRSDAARLFHFPKRRIRAENGGLYEIDESGTRVGRIDAEGGLATRIEDDRDVRLDDPGQVALLNFVTRRRPLVQDMAGVARIAVPDKSFYEAAGYGAMQREVMAHAGDDLALIGDCGSATLAWHVILRHMDNALLDFIEQPALVHAAMEKGAAIAIEKGEFHIDLGIRMLRLNDSAGNMSVISPKMWRTFIFPHMKAVCDALHAYDPGVRIYCHICGNSLPIMGDLVEAGIDCIGPLDPLGHFTCRQAREAVGTDVGLMGGVHTLSFVDGTPEELMEESRGCIEGAGEDGGFILGSGCALPRNSKRENLLALRKAAERFGT